MEEHEFEMDERGIRMKEHEFEMEAALGENECEACDVTSEYCLQDVHDRHFMNILLWIFFSDHQRLRARH